MERWAFARAARLLIVCEIMSSHVRYINLLGLANYNQKQDNTARTHVSKLPSILEPAFLAFEEVMFHLRLSASRKCKSLHQS
jgi:hypothetical protein